MHTSLGDRCKNKPTKCGEIKGKKSNRWVPDLWDESASLYGPLSVYIIIPGTGYTYLYKEGFTCNDDVSSMVSLWLIATLWAISWSAENSRNVRTYVHIICIKIPLVICKIKFKYYIIYMKKIKSTHTLRKSLSVILVIFILGLSAKSLKKEN